MESIAFLLFVFGVGYLFVPKALLLLTTRRALAILFALLFASMMPTAGMLHDLCIMGTKLADGAFVVSGFVDCVLLKVAGFYVLRV